MLYFLIKTKQINKRLVFFSDRRQKGCNCKCEFFVVCIRFTIFYEAGQTVAVAVLSLGNILISIWHRTYTAKINKVIYYFQF